jgi:activating signal cointegrator complex subunit 2
VELDSLVSNVRDLLPHLGEGFVELCLQHYDYKVDEVINAMLEGNLAPHLAQLDQGLPRVAREPQAVAQPELALPGRSVYDDDDFDINTRDTVDLSRVHRGKKNKGGDALKLLDDKRDLGKYSFVDTELFIPERFRKFWIQSCLIKHILEMY